MASIGIDIGTHSTVVSHVNNGSIEIILNNLSNRATPSVLCFTENMRTFGEDGKTRYVTNIKNSIIGMTQYLGDGSDVN